MKTMVPLGFLALLLTLTLAPAAQAEDFDGSKPLLCAPVEVSDCVPGRACLSDTPDQMGAPNFVRIDFKKKTVTGPRATASIASLVKSDTELLLQGVEIGHAFAIALDRASGRMTATLNNNEGAFVLFGSCTPL